MSEASEYTPPGVRSSATGEEKSVVPEKYLGCDICELVTLQLPKLPRAVPLALEIRRSVQGGETRLFGEDLMRLEDIYKTPIEAEGVENIPEKGGLVLAASHVQTSEKYPFDNRGVNILWWASGMAQALEKSSKSLHF